jgi:hypothetical protein
MDCQAKPIPVCQRRTTVFPVPRRAAATVVAGLFLCGQAAAQNPPAFTASPNPVSDAVRALEAQHSAHLIEAAERMPPEKYALQPTPAQMTFGQLIAHVVQTNIAICSGIGDVPSPMTPEALQKVSGTDSKDSLVTAVRASFDYCRDSLAKVEDRALGDEASMFGRRSGRSRAFAMVTIATDWADHYSTAASYLRLNDILPPTAKPAK